MAESYLSIKQRILSRLSAENNELFIISGEEQFGKSYLINEIINSICNKEEHLHLNINLNTLTVQDRILTEVKKCFHGLHEFSLTVDIDHLAPSEQLNILFHGLSNIYKCIIVHFEEFPPENEAAYFTIKSIYDQLTKANNTRLVIFIELSTNNKKIRHDVFKKFKRLKLKVQPYNISLLENEILESWVATCYSEYEFHKNDLNILIENANGSPSNLEFMIDDLIAVHNHFDELSSGINRCRTIDKQMLSALLSSSIKERIKILNENLNKTLQKSSLLGIDVDPQLVENPLNEFPAETNLRDIYDQTRMILPSKLEKYRFSTESIRTSIMQTISKENIKNWNKLLADHHLKQYKTAVRSRDTQNEINLLSKSTIHLFEADKDEGLNIAMHLIHFLVGKMHYSDVISIIDKFKGHIPGNVLIDLERIQADCCVSLLMHERASRIYENHLRYKSSFYDEYEYLSLKLKYAYALYGSGEVQKPLDIAMELKTALEKKCQFYTREYNESAMYLIVLYIETLSFVCSIEETIDDEGLEMHFNQALMLSKMYKLHEQYNELKRRRYIVDKGDEARIMMREALEYFKKKKNSKKVAMILNDLGSELLFQGEYQEAQLMLAESYEYFKGIRSDAYHYPLNLLGIYICITEKDYESGLQKFEEAYEDNFELFSRISIMLNMHICYRKLHQKKEAYDSFEAVQKLAKSGDASSYKVMEPHIMHSEAALYYEFENYEKAFDLYSAFISKFSTRNYIRLATAVYYLRDCCNKLNQDFPRALISYKDMNIPIDNPLVAENVTFNRMMFAE